MNSQIQKFTPEFDYLINVLASLNPISIIIYGSYGRGEGAIYSNNKTDKLFNDIDVLLIVRKKIDILRINNIKDKLLKKIDVQWIDITQKTQIELKKSNASVFNYDLKYHSTILYGDMNILSLIPTIKSEEIEYNEIKILFFTRIWCFLGSYKRGGINDLEGYEAAFFKNQMAKIIFAIIDVILISNNKYVSSYHKKMETFKEFFLADYDYLKKYLSYALENKFSPSNKKILASEIRSTLNDLASEFFKVFSSGLSLAYNKNINGPEQIVKSFKYDHRLLIKKWIFNLFVPSRKNEFNELICRTYLVGSIINKDFFSEAVKYYKFILKGEGKENPSFEDIRINMVKLIF
jgi:predicted nucleotidyltransferase